VFHRKPDTPSDKLGLRILKQENFISQPTKWGIVNESGAIEAYKKQQENGHPDLTACKAGFSSQQCILILKLVVHPTFAVMYGLMVANSVFL